MRIAVVIPTLNEAKHIAQALASVSADSPELLIVADCNSADDTANLARAAGAQVIDGPRLTSRAAALQAGYEYALQHHPDLDAIWFLHADSAPPHDWRSLIKQTLADPAVVGGAFTQRSTFTADDGTRPTHLQRRLLRLVTFINRWRCRATGIAFGDQGFFVRPDALTHVGGIPQAPLMEDVELCRRLKRLGKFRIHPARLSTSPRRFLKHGVLRQSLCDWALLLGHRCGIKPKRLYQHYNQDNLAHADPPPT